MSTVKSRVSKRAQSLKQDGKDRPEGTKLVVSEAQYSEGDVVPMDDGLYEATESSRPLSFNPGQYVTVIRRSDLEAWR